MPQGTFSYLKRSAIAFPSDISTYWASWKKITLQLLRIVFAALITRLKWKKHTESLPRYRTSARPPSWSTMRLAQGLVTISQPFQNTNSHFRKTNCHFRKKQTHIFVNQAPISVKQTPIFVKQTPIFEKRTLIFEKQTPIFEKQTPIYKNKPTIFNKWMSLWGFRIKGLKKSNVDKI